MCVSLCAGPHSTPMLSLVYSILSLYVHFWDLFHCVRADARLRRCLFLLAMLSVLEWVRCQSSPAQRDQLQHSSCTQAHTHTSTHTPGKCDAGQCDREDFNLPAISEMYWTYIHWVHNPLGRPPTVLRMTYHILDYGNSP